MREEKQIELKKYMNGVGIVPGIQQNIMKILEDEPISVNTVEAQGILLQLIPKMVELLLPILLEKLRELLGLEKEISGKLEELDDLEDVQEKMLLDVDGED